MVARLVALLVIAAGSAASASFSSSASVNPYWIKELCAYGEEPGVWRELPNQQGMVFPNGGHLPQLIDTNTSFVGGRYELLNKDCQLKNRFKEYLFDPPPTADAKPLHIAFFGDSVDSQTLEHTCWTDAREHGQNTTLVPHWQSTADCFAQGLTCLTPGSHWELNMCMIRRAHMYGRVVPSLHPDFNYSATGFKPMPYLFEQSREFMLNNSGTDPDFIMLGVHFWELGHLVDGMRPVEGITDDTRILPTWFVDIELQRYSEAVMMMRKVFPKSLILIRTVAPPLHDLESGRSVTHKHWSHRMWIGQMNAIVRAIARKHNIPLVDMGLMAEGFVPQQIISPGDSHHPAQWLNLEAFNVALNIYHDYKQAKELLRR
ncbi:hypothetical protein HYH03_010286 [Edaphochlamys debaryana]|uniref:SGNH hydrolase-type esterase domain-containing protein n=1 Tax=Edaphochlamys debaryana TaxID=47281 RepID=A0A835XWS2_9CHLO|nr:hypothetical protein HYH03_010286 [Edaphochlamys debaryana]|eukprot:KAG2491280.1 hypothetical protein HYH03_010286 [Edaphochlamys debaryana]